MSTEGLAAGLSALAAQDGGFPGDAAAADAAAAAEDATPMRKRLLQRHRVDSGSFASPLAAVMAAADHMMTDGAAEPSSADAVAATPAGGTATPEVDAEEAAFAAELLAQPDMTEVPPLCPMTG